MDQVVGVGDNKDDVKDLISMMCVGEVKGSFFSGQSRHVGYRVVRPWPGESLGLDC